MNKEQSRFRVITREGKEYTVIVKQEINTTNTQIGLMTMPGKKKMVTIDEGYYVKKNSNGAFTIVETMEMAVRN